MLIHILREEGVEDDVDESLLVKTEGVVDNDNERTTWVEYRFPGSETIVHRSVHVTIKQWPEGLGAAIGGFGQAEPRVKDAQEIQDELDRDELNRHAGFTT